MGKRAEALRGGRVEWRERAEEWVEWVGVGEGEELVEEGAWEREEEGKGEKDWKER